MSSKILAGLILLAGVSRAAGAADPFQLGTDLHLSPGVVPITLVLPTTGPRPSASDLAAYQDPLNWRILMQAKPTDAPVSLCDGRDPSGTVLRKPCIASIEAEAGTQQLIIHLTGADLPDGDGRDHLWTVLFQPPPGMVALPVVASFTKTVPANPPTVSGKKTPAKAGFFKPVSDGDSPDYSLSGTFLAGGNTKPIYTLVEQASFYGGRAWGILGVPGVTTAVAINQAAMPPNNRTRFDPDSISGSVSFRTLAPVGGGGLLSGVITNINPVGGEFSRSDPSANIVGGFNSTFVLRRARLSPLAYFVLYPVIGLEGGRNVDKPASIMGTAVDLSHYSGIFRGLWGSDATFAVAAADKKSNVFSITGTYRMRLPAMDEPLVKTMHGATIVDLTTRARNWVEVDITAVPWNFKYLSLNLKYQYGSQPPLFNLVDHQVSVGFTLQGMQAAKPAASKVQAPLK